VLYVNSSDKDSNLMAIHCLSEAFKCFVVCLHVWDGYFIEQNMVV